jgi:hypothetical protein
MVLWTFLSPDGPDQSIVHDLAEGQTIGLQVGFNDYDENPSDLGAVWQMGPPKPTAHFANNVPDVVLLGTAGWVTPTAVSPASWGSIKATFTR